LEGENSKCVEPSEGVSNRSTPGRMSWALITPGKRKRTRQEIMTIARDFMMISPFNELSPDVNADLVGQHDTINPTFSDLYSRPSLQAVCHIITRPTQYLYGYLGIRITGGPTTPMPCAMLQSASGGLRYATLIASPCLKGDTL
jgi:hypothetical protein